MTKKFVCFGEMLWDVFPKERIAGGAPMNVALHLHQLYAEVCLISKVGDDKEGLELLEFVRDYGLSTDCILKDPSLPTGKVLLDDSDKENILYDIVRPASWDNIIWTQDLQEKSNQSDALLFGTLAAREEVSRATLLQLLKTSSTKIFDVNLRAPFYSFELLQELLRHTDILKLNEEELHLLIEMHQLPQDNKKALDQLSERYELEMICVTKGKYGAELYVDDELITHPGYPVTVQDTVGSGDAFLAAFTNSYFEGKTPEQTLDDACALGALVATLKGGTPQYQLSDIEKIKGKEFR